MMPMGWFSMIARSMATCRSSSFTSDSILLVRADFLAMEALLHVLACRVITRLVLKVVVGSGARDEGSAEPSRLFSPRRQVELRRDELPPSVCEPFAKGRIVFKFQDGWGYGRRGRSEEHTSELQSR